MQTPPDSDQLALLQYMLDHFSATPGAILYRGPDTWLALEPTQIGDILVLDSQLLPAWQPPS